MIDQAQMVAQCRNFLMELREAHEQEGVDVTKELIELCRIVLDGYESLAEGHGTLVEVNDELNRIIASLVDLDT